MYLILDKTTKVIMYISDIAEEQTNGTYKIGEEFYILNSICTIKKVNNIPEEVIPVKYMYINKEFVLNPDYVEPVITEEVNNNEENR